MPSSTYSPGVHGVALAIEATSGTAETSGFTYLARKTGHTFDPGLDKQTETYEWMTRVSANDMTALGWVPTLTVRGDVDTVEFPLLLQAATSAPTSGVYKAGLITTNLPTALPTLTARAFMGATDGSNLYAIVLAGCRVRSLAVFVDDSAGKLKYEATLAGTYAGESAAVATVSFNRTGFLFYKNRIIASVDTPSASPSFTAASRQLTSFRLTITNEAAAHFTTVGSNQTNLNFATTPTAFDEGATTTMLELAYWAKVDNAGAYADFITNAAKTWRIVCSSSGRLVSNDTITFYLPYTKYTPGTLESANKMQPIQRVTAVSLYDLTELTNLKVTISAGADT